MAGLTMNTQNTLDTKVTTGCASDLTSTPSSFAGGKLRTTTVKKTTKKTTKKITAKAPNKTTVKKK